MLAIALAAGGAAAQDLQPLEPEGEGPAVFRFGEATDVHGWAADDSPIILERLEGLVILGSEVGRPAVRHDAVLLERLSVDALDALAVELSEWIGRPLTAAGLDRLTEVILRHYDDHDRPMNEVWVPPQTGAGGILQVEVIEGRIGVIGVERMERFNNDLVRQGVHLQPGELLRSSALQADLDWLSRNPFRSAELFAAPGEGVSADFLLRIHERRPWRAYAGYDNTGSESVGRNRWFSGFNWGNGFGLDQVIGYQFTMGDSPDTFQAHALSWEIPIHPWQHFIRLSGTWAETSAEDFQVGLPITADGTGWQVSALYGVPLPRLGDWRQEIRGGVEFRRTDNFVIFGQVSTPQSEVDIVQFRGEWRGTGPLWGGRAELQADLIVSPGDLTARNGREEFEAFRQGADPEYAYARLEATWARPLVDDWSCRLHATTQLASGALLPTEQLGLGGYHTVRGYAERVFLADSGYAMSAEVRTPAWGPPADSWAGKLRLQGVAFLDHGHGWREGEDDESLTGVGLGARAAFGSYGSARFDLGWGLESGDGLEAHAGVTLTY